MIETYTTKSIIIVFSIEYRSINCGNKLKYIYKNNLQIQQIIMGLVYRTRNHYVVTMKNMTS